MQGALYEFIDWATLDIKQGKRKQKLRCPKCDSMRSDKRDKSLLVDIESGYGKCFYCDALTFRKDEIEEAYELPSQEWQNYTKLDDNWLKVLADRGIRQETILELGWTQENYYMPAHQKQVECLVFNYFEGSQVVNKKYRSIDKKFTQSKGGKPIFYNLNSIIGADEIWITEGEMDVASLYEVGVKNVISVPSGASTTDKQWQSMQPYLEGKQIVIAVDMDSKGLKLREDIAQRLGRHNCRYIDFEGKDANEDLMSGILDRSIKDLKSFPVSGTVTASDLYDGILDLYENGLPNTLKVQNPVFGNFNKNFSTMEGQVTVITGIPSHGKSTFIDWYLINLVAENNTKCSWFTPEHTPLELHKTRFIQMVTGKPFFNGQSTMRAPRITRNEIAEYKDWAKERFYFTIQEADKLPTWDWLIDKFKEQLYAFGINYFVIDAFNKVILTEKDKLGEINKVMGRLTHFAKTNNVQVFLIAHPTKMKKNERGHYDAPTLYDVSGSADFRNQTHNGLTVYRDFELKQTRVINQKTKFGFQGSIGSFTPFNYSLENCRYYVPGTDPYGSLIQTQEQLPF